MLSRWGHLFFAFAAALAVWAVATPARASAPLCDPHGATAIAPAVQLQQPETSIDLGTAQEDCFDGLAALSTADDGRAPEPAPSSVAARESLSLNGAPRVTPAASTCTAVLANAEGGERAGARGRVDRPPRG